MSSTWFRRIKKGILTGTHEKKEAPDGLWHKCPECKTTVTTKELEEQLYVCAKCNYHNKINAREYFSFLFDEQHEFLFENITPVD
ncbi:MAG: acetyl-CoA carboxylase carboxyl transferase subunit beta, partial [Taibaiella sp.]|nr:acetyl-CoA carboxylase carboxyl transferase subunit beta [Taibaiella sp.]